MLGYISYGDGLKKPVLGERTLAGGNFTELRLGRPARPNGPLALHRAKLAAEKLREAGVRTAVFPVDFPYTGLFVRQGIRPVDPLPLRRSLAAPLVRRQLETLGISSTEAVVAVSGERAAQETAEAAKALALRYRYVLLSVRIGGDDLAKALRREYGVSLLPRPTPEQLDRADALVLFAPRSDLKLENPILYTLYPGGEVGRGHLPLCLPPALADTVDPNCDREQLSAALFSQGVLSKEDILVEISC